MAKRRDLKGLLFQKVFVGERELTEEIETLIEGLKIDPNAVDDEASEHSALFAYWAVLAEEASAHERWMKRDHDILVAQVERRVRSEFSEKGLKATEGRIATEVALEEDVMVAKEEWLHAQRDAGILAAIRQSLVHRREMIAELMRDRRAEYSASERSA